jgi:hypothetical protein
MTTDPRVALLRALIVRLNVDLPPAALPYRAEASAAAWRALGRANAAPVNAEQRARRG